MFLQVLPSFCFFSIYELVSPQWLRILSHEDIAAGIFKEMLHGKIGPSDVNRHWVYRSRKALLNIQPIREITKSLFRSISENQDSKLHHLIPEAYSPHYNFRRQRTYNVPAAKTKRFANSFFVKCAAVTNSSLR